MFVKRYNYISNFLNFDDINLKKKYCCIVRHNNVTSIPLPPVLSECDNLVIRIRRRLSCELLFPFGELSVFFLTLLCRSFGCRATTRQMQFSCHCPSTSPFLAYSQWCPTFRNKCYITVFK